MSGIRVPVGASADRSLSVVFEPLVEASRKARAKIKSDAERAAEAEAKAAQKAAAAAARVYAQKEAAAARAAAKEIAEAERAAQSRIRAEQRVADQKQRALERAQAAAKRAAEVEERAAQRRAEADVRREMWRSEMATRDRTREEARSRQAVGQRRLAVVQDSFQTFTGVAGAAGRGAMNLARGAGIDFDIQGGVRRATDIERRAVDLSASAYIKGAPGQQGYRVEATEIERTARSVADLAAYDPGKVIEGLQKFVGKTGDLATGNAALADMAKLARATGSELEDVVDAAGDVSANLGDAIPAGAEKAKVVGRIMQMIAGQGKIGAVEMKDLAVQMAKLAASSTAFQGDREALMGQLGAFAQMSRAMGGSASATQAATSVAALINTFKTPARMAEFEAATGKKVYDQTTGMLRNPKDLLVEALGATQGDPAAFKKIFANVQGARAVEGFATIYREARAGALGKGATGKEASDEGIRAVNAKFAEFARASVGDEQVKDDFGRAMSTTAAKAQIFQNQIDKTTAELASNVLPKLIESGPMITRFLSGFGDLASWAASNPYSAVSAALVASVGKAAIGEAMTTAMKGAIEKMGAAGGKLAFGAAAATISIAAATIVAEYLNQERDSAGKKAIGDIEGREEGIRNLEQKFKATGTLSDEDIASLKRFRDAAAAQQQQASGADTQAGRLGMEGTAGDITRGAYLAGVVGFTGKTWQDVGQEEALSGRQGQLAGQVKGADALLSAVQDLTRAVRDNKRVSIDNMPAGAGPSVDNGARASTSAGR